MLFSKNAVPSSCAERERATSSSAKTRQANIDEFYHVLLLGLALLPDFSYNVVQMPNTESLGQFEQLVLTAIVKLNEDAYGVTIHKTVQELADPRPVSLGAVYVTLDRLEDKGMVTSWLSDPTPERGGRAKRCYRLQALGERVLRESAVTARRMWDVLAEVWDSQVWGKGGRAWNPVRPK
jgi:PadR family transcriptional regulator, regulatory protein PadR